MKSVSAMLRAAAFWLRGRDARGDAAVEFALVSVPLCLFLFGIIATGQAVWLQSALNSSVAGAARCASVNPTLCGTASQIQSYAAAQAGAGFTTSIFSVTTPACGNLVSATYPFSFTIPFVALSVNLTAQACYPT